MVHHTYNRHHTIWPLMVCQKGELNEEYRKTEKALGDRLAIVLFCYCSSPQDTICVSLAELYWASLRKDCTSSHPLRQM